LKQSKCPICQSNDIDILISEAPDHVTGHLFQILSCQSCKFCFTDPIPDHMEIYYPDKYRAYGPFTAGIMKIFYRHRVRKWTRMIGRPGNVLEVGCGSGLMLEAFKRRGWSEVGIERTESIAEQVRSTLGLNVVAGGIENIKQEPHFDLIVLYNVLEHLPQPLNILKECVLRLAADGLLIVNVQNIDSWQARFGGALWQHLDPPRHFSHFAPQSLRRALERVGFNTYNITFVSFEHDPFGWVQTTLNKIMNRPNILTRYLMGIETFNLKVFLSFLFAAIMIIPAMVLSMLSWQFKKGALMQFIATRKIKLAEQTQ